LCSTLEIYSTIQSYYTVAKSGECFSASVKGAVSTLDEVNNKAFEECLIVCSWFYATFYWGHLMSFFTLILFFFDVALIINYQVDSSIEFLFQSLINLTV